MPTIQLGRFQFTTPCAHNGFAFRAVATLLPLDVERLRRNVGPGRVSVGVEAVCHLARVVGAHASADDVRHVLTDIDAAGL